jgi:transaldolase
LGAKPQRPLWASTGTKNPAYSDVLYVEELIGPEVISTMPEQTLRTFADHGQVSRTLDSAPDAAERILTDAASAGIELGAVTAGLERDGVRSFCDSYRQLLDCIEGQARHARLRWQLARGIVPATGRGEVRRRRQRHPQRFCA